MCDGEGYIKFILYYVNIYEGIWELISRVTYMTNTCIRIITNNF